MTWDGMRGYAQAVNDISGIARARLTDVAREALRVEIERAGQLLGLPTAEEVAVLKRTVERLERRLASLEETAGVRAHADHPPARPSAARSRTGAPRPGKTSAKPTAKPGSPSAGAPGAPPEPAPSPTPTSPAPAAADPATTPPVTPPAAPATPGARRPVRRPRAVAKAADDAAAASAAGAAGEGTDEGSAS